MKWQRNLLGLNTFMFVLVVKVVGTCTVYLAADRPKLFVISQNEAMWASSSFYLTVIINVLVALFYPFDNSVSGKCHIPDKLL